MNKNVNSKIKVSTKTKRQNKILLKFLKKTKEGKYAVIEKSSVKYARWKTDSVQANEEEYYYALS